MSKSKRVSLQDIAKKVGVSRMTVSLALRDAPQISEKTKKRIKKIADIMGYQSDPRVSKLYSQIRSVSSADYMETIAVVRFEEENPLKEPTDIFFNRLLDSCTAEARKHGFLIEKYYVSASEMRPERLAQILQSRGIQNVVAAPLVGSGHLFPMDCGSFCVATVAYSIRQPKMNRVSPNHFQAMQLALEKVDGYGFQRIGFIGDPELASRISCKWAGAFFEYQSHIPVKRRVPPLQVSSSANEKIKHWFEKYRPDVIIGGGTIQTFHTLQGEGIQIPLDASYVHMHSADVLPGMTYIDQNEKALGEALFKMIYEQWMHDKKGMPFNPKTVMVDSLWRDGKTVRSSDSRK